jgi:hypothetical protein
MSGHAECGESRNVGGKVLDRADGRAVKIALGQLDEH